MKIERAPQFLRNATRVLDSFTQGIVFIFREFAPLVRQGSNEAGIVIC